MCKFVGLFGLCFTLSLSSQAQTYTAAKIVFNNPGEYTQQQLEATAGLHPGSTFTATGLGAAAQHLVDTGFFENAGATLDGAKSAVTVKFDIKPIGHAQMLPVSFQNFVWLTPAEITAAIQSGFPLFQGFLPENSPRQDDLKAALTAALAARSISATVEYNEFDPTLRHPVREIVFRVTKPSVGVANVKLTGVTPALVPFIQKSVNATARTAYSEGLPAPGSDQTTAERILEPLLDAGYIQAALTDTSITATPSSDGFGLVLAARLAPGEVFRISAVTFAGTPLISSESFAGTSKLHAGDLASRAAMLESLAPIDKAYRHRGYMDVAITAAPAADATAHTVAYTITVQPGEQYRIKQVTPSGLDPAALADFDRGFLLKPGELYHPDYVAAFLKQNTALLALAHYAAAYKAYADPGTHTVDLVLTFYKRS